MGCNYMDINIGELNKRISIVIISTVQNDNGFEVEQETIYFKPFAKVQNMSGTQMYKAGALYDKSITRFVIRYRRDKELKTTMRIRYKNDLFQIIDINNYNENNEFIEIMGQVVLNG